MWGQQDVTLTYQLQVFFALVFPFLAVILGFVILCALSGRR